MGNSGKYGISEYPRIQFYTPMRRESAYIEIYEDKIVTFVKTKSTSTIAHIWKKNKKYLVEAKNILIYLYEERGCDKHLRFPQ